MSQITAFLQSKYGSYGKRGRAICHRLERLWADHRELADSHFLKEFCSGDDEKFVQRYWEMRVGELLRSTGWQLSSSDNGPDFKAAKGDEVVWVEAVAPNAGTGKNRLPEEYILPRLDGRAHGYWIPTADIVLRITAAIGEKHKKLVGYTDAKNRYRAGYLSKGIVRPDEAYVVAINTALLGSCGNIGSHFPSVAEAVFPLGPIEVVLDRETLG